MTQICRTLTIGNPIGSQNRIIPLFKQMVVDAGFAVRTDTESLFEFWCDRGCFEYEEDRPRWRLRVPPGGQACTIAPVREDWYMPENYFDGSSELFQLRAEGQTYTVFLDGDKGTFAIFGSDAQLFRFVGGSRIKRIAADMREGIMGRFCLAEQSAEFGGAGYSSPPTLVYPPAPAYLTDTVWGISVGEMVDNLWVLSWSPVMPMMGEGMAISNAAQVPAGVVPLRTVSPIFAPGHFALPPIVAGELADIMMVTSGYSDGDVAIPGWSVLSADACRLLLRTPAQVTDLGVF